jgi:hypothetical protein
MMMRPSIARAIIMLNPISGHTMIFAIVPPPEFS